jgi:hypothetical protein
MEGMVLPFQAAGVNAPADNCCMTAMVSVT